MEIWVEDHAGCSSRLWKMGPEGVVCTRESSPYRATEKPSPYWMKVKNPRYSHAKDAKNCSSEPDCPQQVCSVDLSAVLSRSFASVEWYGNHPYTLCNCRWIIRTVDDASCDL